MRILPAMLFAGLALFGMISCDIKNNYPQADYNPDQNIILFRTDSSAAGVRPMPVANQLAMIRKANQVLKDAGRDTISVKAWCPCDSSLLLLQGKDLGNLHINGKELASNTRPSDGVEGRPPYDDITYSNGDNMLNWPQLIGDGSPNYVLTLPYNTVLESHGSPTPLLNFGIPDRAADGSFIIAITDTGIQPDLYAAIKPYMWINPDVGPTGDNDRNGLMDDRVGWDFVTNSRIPYDSNGHGTVVTSLIQEQLQGNKWAGRNVRFMFLKTFDKEGQGLLFNNLCALSYAEQKGAKIINASWGFYGSKSSAVLDYFINELNAHHITLVAAAGNQKDNLESKLLGIIPYNYRDLESNPFWPANFSKTHGNVITATTVHPKEVSLAKTLTSRYKDFINCPDQNYSPKFVNLGVFNNGNDIAPNKIDYCVVKDITDATGKKTKSGTSFAAPVVTGRLVSKLGQNWHTHVSCVLLHDLSGNPANGLASTPELIDRIDGGLYILRK